MGSNILNSHQEVEPRTYGTQGSPVPMAIFIQFQALYTSVVGYNGMNLQLFFYNPDLWWPNGMGKQFLYNVHITVDVKGYGEYDAWSHLFGFCKIESHIDSAIDGRYCFICLLEHFTQVFILIL